MNQAEQASQHIRERMTLKDRAKLVGTAVAAGVLAVGLSIPIGEALPTQSPAKSETTPETTAEIPTTTLQSPETTVIATEVEAPVTVSPEVAPTDEAKPIIDEDGNVVPVLIEPAVIAANTQPATSAEQGAQEPQEVQAQVAPASTVLDSGALVALGSAIPVPANSEQPMLYDNGEITEAITPDGGIAEATTSDGAVVATATAAVPGN